MKKRRIISEQEAKENGKVYGRLTQWLKKQPHLEVTVHGDDDKALGLDASNDDYPLDR